MDGDPHPPAPRRSRLRWLGLGAFSLVLIIYLLLPALSRTEMVRGRLESFVTGVIKNQVRFSGVSLGYNFAVHVDELSIAAADNQPFLQVATAEIFPSLLGRSLGLRLQQPHLFLSRLPASGSKPMSPTSSEGTSTSLPLRNVAIDAGYLHIPFGKEDLPLGPLTLSFDLAADGASSVEMSLDKMKTAVGGIEVQTTGASFSGDVKPAGSAFQVSGNFDFKDVRAHDASGERAAEKLSLSGKLAGTRTAATPFSGRIDLVASKGELLWDRFYIDLGNHGFEGHGDVSYAAQLLKASQLQLRLKELATVEAKGLELSTKTGLKKVDATLEVPIVAPIYQLGLREPFQDSLGLLKTTEVTGKLRGEARYRSGKGGGKLSGRLLLSEAAIVGTAAALRGLDVDLPFQLGAVGDVSPQAGHIRWQSLHLGEADARQGGVGLESRVNSIATTEPLALPVFGGVLRLTQLEGRDLDTPARSATTAMAVEDLDLASLSASLGGPKLQGKLAGSIPGIVVSSEAIRSQGEIRIQAFEGTVSIRDLHVDQLFSSVPTLGLDVDFDDISLGQLTKALEVGRVKGVVHGHVHNLAIVSGEASRFDAWLESKSKKGVSQKISVRAIRQISILGGSGNDPFTKGVLSFFDDYGYAKLGIRCHLENDNFMLQGVERVGEQEYLVVGSTLPPRVNVISHSQTISFSELIQRLERIGAEPAAETEKGHQP